MPSDLYFFLAFGLGVYIWHRLFNRHDRRPDRRRYWYPPGKTGSDQPGPGSEYHGDWGNSGDGSSGS